MGRHKKRNKGEGEPAATACASRLGSTRPSGRGSLTTGMLTGPTRASRLRACRVMAPTAVWGGRGTTLYLPQAPQARADGSRVDPGRSCRARHAQALRPARTCIGPHRHPIIPPRHRRTGGRGSRRPARELDMSHGRGADTVLQAFLVAGTRSWRGGGAWLGASPWDGVRPRARGSLRSTARV